MSSSSILVGLGQVVVGAELHRLHRGGDVLEAGHHDDLGHARGTSCELAQHLDALLARHPHVEHDDVVRVLAQRGPARPGRRPRRRPRGPPAPARARSARAGSARRRRPARGSPGHGARHAGQHHAEDRSLARARDVTSMRPPWSATMPWAMARPRPVPCPGGLVVKNGSKMRGSDVLGDPRPLVLELDLDLVRARARVRIVQRAAALHRLERVGGEAEEHLAELALVGDDLGQRRDRAR